MDIRTVESYQVRASEFVATYRQMRPSRLYDSVRSFFHPGRATADIGCGSGRDVAWLCSRGYPTTGYDASNAMLGHARAEYPDGSFFHARLPELDGIGDGAYNNVFCSAVLMHLPREELITAVINLSRILATGGRLILSYRGSRNVGEREADGRLFTAIPAGKLTLLLESAGFRVVTTDLRQDEDRPEIFWTVILSEKGPLDRSRGLERVQNILVQDAKTATYKLALIRAFCQISRTQPHIVRWGSGCVYVPVWDVSVKWLTFYWPIITSPAFIAQNRGETPGCAKPIAFRKAIADVAAQQGGSALWSVLREIQIDNRKYHYCLNRIAKTIIAGPVTYSGGSRDPVFRYVDNAAIVPPQEPGSLFGWIRVPEEIWLDISRFDHWIEDSVVMRWAALSAEMNRGQTMEQIIPYLLSTPYDVRDTTEVRALILGSDQPVHCVWTGKLITRDLHIDHAIPYSVWNNNDYWNLLPCNNGANLKKSDSLPTQSLINDRSEIIVDYWRLYRSHFSSRFDHQITAALGCLPTDNNWETIALSGFKETVQRISATRGLGGWQP